MTVSGCNGTCCRYFVIGYWTRIEHLKKALDEKFCEDPDLPQIIDMLYDTYHVKMGDGFGCRHWDRDTMLCKNYENRPHMCKDYPYNTVCAHCGSVGPAREPQALITIGGQHD